MASTKSPRRSRKPSDKLRVCDFANSYGTFTVPDGHNTARIQLDASLRITSRGGETLELFLGTPCKSERMYLKRDLFQNPNFDFTPVFGRNEYVLIRTFESIDPKRTIEWDPGLIKDRFATLPIDLAYFKKARQLKTEREIVKATLANRPIVARTFFRDPKSGASAVAEYLVKTMNVAKDTQRFQTDTGPLLVTRWIAGDLAPRPEWAGKFGIENFVMAFACCNRFTGGDLVLREPTPIAGSERKVMHYSKLVPMPKARHEFFTAL